MSAADVILGRMAASLTELERRWKGKRLPKAFYLVEDDWQAFMSTKPLSIESIFGNNPPITVIDAVFSGVPVRRSKGTVGSRLYDHTSTGRAI